MEKESKNINLGKDEAISSVPLNRRQHWTTPAIIFGGLEFTIPVIMVGAAIVGSFGMFEILWILVIALILQWTGNSIIGFIGAKTGRSSSVIARSSFGVYQARFIIGLMIFVVSMGWWAIQTAVAGEAISAMLGIDYHTQWFAWAGVTVVIGLLFAIPAIIGYSSMKWTDYLAVPAGLLLIIAGIVLSLQHTGFEKIISWHPEASMTFTAAISLVIGANVTQWLIAADYTRYARPKKKDNILIPLGIVVIGFPLFLVGAVMSVGVGEPDIVNVMVGLGFPFWGFLILWLATWTSQLVNNYSMGLAFSNLLNVNSGKGRALLTLIGTLIAIVLALAGILDYFEAFLNFSAIIYSAGAGVVMADFFFVRKQQWANNQGWNWMATIAIVLAVAVGGYTQYINRMGIPAIQTIFTAGVVYIIAMQLKHKWVPDHFTSVESVSKEDTAEGTKR